MHTYKYLLFSLLLAALALQVSAQHVNFHPGSWEEVRATAEKEGKWVLVDAYTEWCYWCKVMEKETFTHPEISDFINEHFVSTQLDFEKEAGLPLAMKFRVKAYPTLLLFNPDGQLTGKLAGYIEDDSLFLSELKARMSPESGQVFGFDSRELDLDYPEFVHRLYAPRDAKQRVKTDEIEAWLDAQEDLFNEIAWTVLHAQGANTKYIDHLIQNIDRYQALYGNTDADAVLYNLVSAKGKQAIEAKDEALLGEAIDLCAKMEAFSEMMALDLKNKFYRTIEDWPRYTENMKATVNQLGSHYPHLIHGEVLQLLESSASPSLLKKAVDWMDVAIQARPDKFSYQSTLAELHFTNQEWELAEHWTRTALKTGAEKDEDVQELEILLEEILSTR